MKYDFELYILTMVSTPFSRAVHLYPHRFLGAVGHHDSRFGVDRIDISASGNILASISQDSKVKFWDIGFLEEMDYNKTKKPYHNRKKQRVRRKEQRMAAANEQEHQLPSSNKGNRKDFFKDL